MMKLLHFLLNLISCLFVYIGYRIEIVCLIGTLSTILQHFKPKIKLSDPLLLANGTLSCQIYPAGKVDISRHLATPGFPQCEWVTILLASSVWMLVLCVVKYSRPPDLKSSSNVSLPFAWARKRPQLSRFLKAIMYKGELHRACLHCFLDKLFYFPLFWTRKPSFYMSL